MEHSSNEHAGSAAIVILLGGLALLLVSPGALLVFAAQHVFDLPLDVQQRWTLSIVASIVVWVAVRVRNTAGTAFAQYAGLAALTSGALVVARFGLHAEWPREVWRSFFGPG